MTSFIKVYSYNRRRYSLPWIAKVDKKAKITFDEKIGAYTGSNGEEGVLFFYDNPTDKQVYAFGQKDYIGNNTIKKYCIYINNDFYEVPSKDLIFAIEDPCNYFNNTPLKEVDEYL